MIPDIAKFKPILKDFEIVEHQNRDGVQILRLKITFIDLSVLFVTDIFISFENRRKYSFHWQNMNEELISRWDNAPHFPDISSYPHSSSTPSIRNKRNCEFSSEFDRYFKNYTRKNTRMSDFFKQLICPKTHTKLVLSADGKTLNNTSTEEPVSYDVNDIVDLVFPRELFEQDRKEQVAYNDAHARYDRGVSWVFESLHANEAATRKQMINLLKLKPGMKVLEVGAGTGKDSAFIIDKITPGGHAVLSDLSPAMLSHAKEKFADKKDVTIDYFIGNGSYLPFEDNTFDALFHFGGINTFSERAKAFEEFNRVVKVGGRVVVGDESVGAWLRDQKTYQILMDANPMFADLVPMQDLPKNIKDVKLQWIFGNGYYVLDFRKTKKAPTVNVNLPIPNKDFVDNWKLRAIKNRKKPLTPKGE